MSIREELAAEITRCEKMGRRNYTANYLLSVVAVLSSFFAGLSIALEWFGKDVLAVLSAIPAAVLIASDRFQLGERTRWAYRKAFALKGVLSALQYEDVSEAEASKRRSAIDTEYEEQWPGIRQAPSDAQQGSTSNDRAAREDPFWVTSSDLLHWLWSWQVQFRRLKESTSVDGRGSTPVETRQAFSRTSLDEHLLAVVGGHVVKAIERFGDELPTNTLERDQLKALSLLRNLEELKLLANKRDVPYQSLLKMYLAERIEQELRKRAS